MTVKLRRFTSVCSFPVEVRLMGASVMLGVIATLTSGCGGSDSLTVSGEVSLDGVGVPAEIQIEQLDAEGNRVGRSSSAYADNRGRFSTAIVPAVGNATSLNCRMVVRVSTLADSGLPSALDERSTPEKTIRLRRTVSDNDSLAILLTR